MMESGSRRRGFCLGTAGIAVVAAAILAAPLRSLAQPVAPVAVRVQLHPEVKDRRFVPLLMQRLASLLQPPVGLGEFELDLEAFAPMLPLFPSDAQPMLRALGERMLADGSGATNAVYVIETDIRLTPARFSFAASLGGPRAPVRLSIVSLARLRSLRADGSDRDPELSAQRVAKLVAKNVARLAGYPGEQGRCIFAFPRSLGELDATAENFCGPDLTALVQAGVARR